MENKKGPSFILIIIAIIVGGALYKQIDFQNFKVEQPALSAVYLITFAVCVSIILKNSRNK